MSTRQSLFALIKIFIFWLAMFVIQKPIFLAVHYFVTGESFSAVEWFGAMFHGLTMDISLSSFITVVAGLILYAGTVTGKYKAFSIIWKIILFIFSSAVLISCVAYVSTYQYWGIILDMTPIQLMMCGSIKSIFSSHILLNTFYVIIFLSLIVGVFCIQADVIPKILKENCEDKNRTRALALLLTSILFFYLTLSGFKNSCSIFNKAFFSQELVPNHATVNPLYSFIKSLSPFEHFSEQYRFMDDEDARTLSDSIIRTRSDNTEKVLKCLRPDIYLVILESFSTNLWDTYAVPNLKAVGDSALIFNNFYSNSFRTEKAISSIICGFPALPSTSIMLHHQKSSLLPSIVNQMPGYSAKYFYGGEVNPGSNRHSFITTHGFPSMTTILDFPKKERTQVWGVPDEILISRALSDVLSSSDDSRVFCIIQTSSSHQPYDVPYHRLDDKVLNAFAYTDSCAGHLIEMLHETGRWDNSLVIFVGDHWGCYPKFMAQNDLDRFRCPFIWTGGAVSPEAIEKYRGGVPYCGSQQDIAATLLGQLDIPHDEMIFSKDLFDPDIPHFAFISVPDMFGMVTDSAAVIFDNRAHKSILKKGSDCDSLVIYGQAYLQRLYDEIEKL